MQERNFEVEVNGEVVEGTVIKPTPEILESAQIVYNKSFQKHLKAGGILAQKYVKILIEQGLWSEEEEKRVTLLHLQIKVKREKLKDHNQTEEEARQVATEIREHKQELEDLIARQNSFADNTVEGLADAARFNHMCQNCILDKNTRKPYYNSPEELIKNFKTPFGEEAVNQFAALINDVDPSFATEDPEEIFFKRFGETEEELSDSDKEVLSLLKELTKEESDVDMNTISYGKKKKRGRPKKAV